LRRHRIGPDVPFIGGADAIARLGAARASRPVRVMGPDGAGTGPPSRAKLAKPPYYNGTSLYIAPIQTILVPVDV
jgi:hypothetical protein